MPAKLRKLLGSNTALMLLAALLAALAFLVFQRLLSSGPSQYTSEIAAAVFGSLITILITAIMLNKQSDVDMRKDRNSTMLAERLRVYNALMDELKEVLATGEVTPEARVAVQILNQRLAFVASREVLEAFRDFANAFALAAEDGLVTEDEMGGLLDAAGKLSVKIRKDIASREELQDFEEGKFQELVIGNVKSLKTTKTTEEGFMAQCDAGDRRYFASVLDHLKERGARYTWGTVGFSIQDRQGRSVAYCIPTSSRRRGVEILRGALAASGGQAAGAGAFLASKGVDMAWLESGKKKTALRTSELSAQDFCEWLSQVV